MTNIDRDVELKEAGQKPIINFRNNVLTPEGVRQAQEFGEALATGGAAVRNIVCSPLARTKQTAYTIAGYLDGMPMIHYDRAFREIEWEIGAKFHRLDDSIKDFDTKSAAVDYKPLIIRRKQAFSLESQLEVYQRVTARLRWVVDRYASQGDLLIVSHYFPTKAIRAFVEHGDAGAMPDFDPRNLCDVSYPLEQVLEALKEAELDQAT